MVDLIDRLGVIPERIDIGGGLFGKMEDSLKVQFKAHIPTYQEYALAAAQVFADYFNNKNIKPELLIEPGNGALCTMIEVATGVKPTYIGKPSSIIVASALKMLNAQGQDAILVGDNYDTDIMAGINCNIDSLLTLTGVTNKEQLKEKDKKPTYIVENLDEWKL